MFKRKAKHAKINTVEAIDICIQGCGIASPEHISLLTGRELFSIIVELFANSKFTIRDRGGITGFNMTNVHYELRKLQRYAHFHYDMELFYMPYKDDLFEYLKTKLKKGKPSKERIKDNSGICILAITIPLECKWDLWRLDILTGDNEVALTNPVWINEVATRYVLGLW